MKNHVMFLAALMVASGSALAEPSTLYIADPEGNAIYVRHSDSEDLAPEILSGTLGISTNDAAFLSPSMVLFQPLAQESTLAAVNLQTGLLEHVAEYAEGERVAAIGTGPGGEGTFLIRSNSVLEIGEARREMATGNWQIVRKEFPNPEGSPGSLSLLKSQENTYFFAHGNAGINGPANLSLVRTGDEASITPVSTSPGGHRLYRNSVNGRVLVIAGFGSEAIVSVFEPDGTPVMGEDVVNSQALRLSHRTGEWSTRPELALIAHGRVLADDPPFGNAPTELFSAFGEGVLDPTRDPGGAIAMVRTGENSWSYYDVVTSEIVDLDVSTGMQERRLTRTIGEGPPFGQIQAMTLGPDGDLHVLCADLAGYRILKVDTFTGNRTLQASLPLRLVEPALAIDAEGDYLIVTVDYQEGAQHDYTTWKVPVDGGERTPVFTSPGPLTFEDLRLQPDGSMLALSKRSGRTSLERLDASGRERLNGLTASVSNFELTAETMSMRTFEGTVTVPEDFSGIAVDRIRVLISLDPPQNPSGPLGAMPHSLIAPDGTPYTWEAPLRGYLDENLQGQLAVEHFIGTDSISPSGEWRIVTSIPPHFLPSITPVATIEFIGGNRTVKFGQRADGTLALLGGFPASLRNLDPASLTLTAAPLSLPADEAYKYLDKASQVIEDPNGGGLFVASYETPLVYRIDAAGQASVYTSGRPIDVNAHLMGLSEVSRMLLAVGPKAEPDLRPSGWMLQ